MKLFELKTSIQKGELDKRLAYVYGGKAQALSQRDRYLELLESFEKLFPGNRDGVRLFSTPGRTEVAGNHTDHNHGKVLAASIDLDTIAAVTVRADDIITVASVGFPAITINLNELEAVESEKGDSAALVRGICARFRQLGMNIGGFDAVTTTKVLKGSGLSSSAAFEVLIATILNELYNNGKLSAVELAVISQYAENVYFGKPCGLMDQTACAVGGFVYIDFGDPANPIIEKLDVDFEQTDHILCIVDTGGSHSDLTDDYKAIGDEMRAVAKLLGGEVLRDVPSNTFFDAIPKLRAEVGDRALERAIHFYRENERVEKEVAALTADDFEKFKKYFQLSGYSSFMYNQNVYTSKSPEEQPVALALAISDNLLSDKGGVWRVHGGGFAGTVQSIMPKAQLNRYMKSMKAVFGEKSCYILSIRTEGTSEI